MNSAACVEGIGISKAYGGKSVLKNLFFSMEKGQLWRLLGESGAGKTTLFRILLGLEKADEGRLLCRQGFSWSAVFQEDRLADWLTAVQNVELALNGALSVREIYDQLLMLLPEDSLAKPVRELSGGMKRRVSLVRAVAKDSDGIILDEPFTGLDHRAMEQAAAYLMERQHGRLLLLASHQWEETLFPGKRIYELALPSG